MGLDVGIISMKYLAVPRGRPYQFAGHLAAEGAPDAYMFGGGNSWIPFTQRQVLRMMGDFARELGLSSEERREVREWAVALPWIGGWQKLLPPDDGRDSEYDYHPVLDNADDRDGGIIELHFNW